MKFALISQIMMASSLIVIVVLQNAATAAEPSAKDQPSQVYVLGHVNHTGPYSFPKHEIDPLNPKPKEAFTISKVLVMAGLKKNADFKNIHVTRLHPKAVIDVNLSKLMLDGSVTGDLALEPGDVIYVPEISTASGIATDSGKTLHIEKRIRVMGAVQHPGLLAGSQAGEKLSSVISRAGGFSNNKTGFTILITRRGPDSLKTIERIEVDDNQFYSDQLVKAGSIVLVQTLKTYLPDPPIPNIPGLPANVPIGDPPKQGDIEHRRPLLRHYSKNWYDALPY